MPVGSDDIGHGEYTEIKHAQLLGLLRMHAQICASIIQKHHRQYHYIDLNAGTGNGSPAIAIEAVRARIPNAQFLLCERNPDNVASLKALYGGTPGINIQPGNHDETVEPYVRLLEDFTNGILFHDPNGVPNVELLQRVSQFSSMNRIDILLYVSATGLKRARTATSSGDTLSEIMSKVNKTHWLVRRRQGPQQWTFLIGTNWASFPQWEKEGFFGVETSTGQAILDPLDLTRSEMQGRFQSKMDLS